MNKSQEISQNDATACQCNNNWDYIIYTPAPSEQCTPLRTTLHKVLHMHEQTNSFVHKARLVLLLNIC